MSVGMPQSPRKNLIRTMKRQGFDTVPVDFDFSPSQTARFKAETGASDPYEYFSTPLRWLRLGFTTPIDDRKRWFDPVELTEGTYFDDYGVGHSPGGDQSFHFTQMRHPLKGDRSSEEIRDYPLPRMSDEGPAELGKQVAALHARGLAAGGALACTVWESAWYLRSMEDLLADMMAGDERATVLLDRVTELALGMATTYAEQDCDVLQLGDDIGMQNAPMMGMEFWRNWLKPRLASVIAAARSRKPDILIYYHSCGYVLPFIDDLIEIGVDILNPVQPESMPFPQVYAKWGKRLSFWGTIGTQTTLPFGSPDDVRHAVRENLALCGEAGGIVIAPTHVLEPEVPWENFMAMLDAAKGY